MSSNLDVRILLDLNSLLSSDGTAGRIFDFIGNNPLFRGSPVLFPVAALWFSGDSLKRRSRMLAGLMATCVALFLAVSLQHHLAIHVRPFLDPALHMNPPVSEEIIDWDHLNSFPSDTATLYFALSTVVILENRMIGSIAFLWSLITVGVTRVATGWHYPSDILGGFVLGVGLVYLSTRLRPFRAFVDRLLRRCEPRPYVLHALLFLFLADAYSLFPGLQGIYQECGAIEAHLVGHNRRDGTSSADAQRGKAPVRVSYPGQGAAPSGH